MNHVHAEAAKNTNIVTENKEFFTPDIEFSASGFYIPLCKLNLLPGLRTYEEN